MDEIKIEKTHYFVDFIIGERDAYDEEKYVDGSPI